MRRVIPVVRNTFPLPASCLTALPGWSHQSWWLHPLAILRAGLTRRGQSDWCSWSRFSGSSFPRLCLLHLVIWCFLWESWFHQSVHARKQYNLVPLVRLMSLLPAALKTAWGPKIGLQIGSQQRYNIYILQYYEIDIPIMVFFSLTKPDWTNPDNFCHWVNLSPIRWWTGTFGHRWTSTSGDRHRRGFLRTGVCPLSGC